MQPRDSRQLQHGLSFFCSLPTLTNCKHRPRCGSYGCSEQRFRSWSACVGVCFEAACGSGPGSPQHGAAARSCFEECQPQLCHVGSARIHKRGGGTCPFTAAVLTAGGRTDSWSGASYCSSCNARMCSIRNRMAFATLTSSFALVSIQPTNLQALQGRAQAQARPSGPEF